MARAAGIDGAADGTEPAHAEGGNDPPEGIRMVLVRMPDGLAAVALSQISRLEHIAAARIEEVGGRLVTQYRGRLMPLVGTLDRARPDHPAVVFADPSDNRCVGLLVDEILDVVTDGTGPLPAGEASGMGVVAGRAARIVDAEAVMAQAFPPAAPARRPGGASLALAA